MHQTLDKNIYNVSEFELENLKRATSWEKCIQKFLCWKVLPSSKRHILNFPCFFDKQDLKIAKNTFHRFSKKNIQHDISWTKQQKTCQVLNWTFWNVKKMKKKLLSKNHFMNRDTPRKRRFLHFPCIFEEQYFELGRLQRVRFLIRFLFIVSPFELLF